MEAAFWQARNEVDENSKIYDISETHDVIEHINGVQYVYACNCNKCVTPYPFIEKKQLIQQSRYLAPKPGWLSSAEDCDYCYFDVCDLHTDHQLVLSKNHLLSQNYEKKKYWNSKSRRRAARKKEQKLIRKLVAQSDIQNE